MEEAQNRELELERINNKNNTYATNKSVSQISLNTESIIFIIGIMITVFNAGKLDGFSIALITCICGSIVIKIAVFSLLVILAKSSEEQIGRYTATSLNNLVTVLSAILPIIAGTIEILRHIKNTS